MELEIDKIESFFQINSFIQYFAKKEYEIKVFIDTSDVLSMLHGLENMRNNNNELKHDIYQSSTTQVHSLIYGNWLKGVHMMVPHQEELVKYLKNESHFSSLGQSFIQQLWEKVVTETTGLTKSDFEQPLDNGDFIAKLTPVIGNLYKAIYLLGETYWRDRFKKLLDENILIFDQNSEDLIEIVKSELFKKLHWGFKKLRPQDESSRNNWTDAMALCILHKRLAQFVEDQGNYLPIWFDEKGLFQKVINHTKTAHYFEHTFNDVSFNVIVNQDFLIYYALNLNTRKFEVSLNKSAYETFAEFRNLPFGISEKAESFIKDYSEMIDKLNQSRFLATCWISPEDVILKLVENLFNVKNVIFRSPEAIEILNKFIDEKISALTTTTSNFSIFKQIYDTISTANEKKLKMFNKNLEKYHVKGDSFDVMNELSLIRFSVEASYVKKANEIISTLLFPGEHPGSTVINYVVENVLSVLNYGRNDNQSIIVSVLVLWVIEEYKLIDEIFQKLNYDYVHYSEAFVHASSIAKIGKYKPERERVEKILRGVKATEKWDFAVNYKTAIGASYIYYQLWYKRFHNHFFTTLTEPKPANFSDIRSLFDNAVKYVDMAIDWMEKADLEGSEDAYMLAKYYYALNCKIYYITIGAENSSFFKLKKEVNLLEELETNHSDIWEYRYHDTLSLYYLRRARKASELKNLDKYDFYYKKAKTRNKDAMQLVFSIEDQLVFKLLSDKIQADSFEDEI